MTWECLPNCGLCCHEPWLFPSEVEPLVAREPVRPYVLVHVSVDPDHYVMRTMDHRCAYLGRDGRCTVYEIRPWVCHHYGPKPEDYCPFIDGTGKARLDKDYRWDQIHPERLKEYREKGVLH